MCISYFHIHTYTSTSHKGTIHTHKSKKSAMMSPKQSSVYIYISVKNEYINGCYSSTVHVKNANGTCDACASDTIMRYNVQN